MALIFADRVKETTTTTGTGTVNLAGAATGAILGDDREWHVVTGRRTAGGRLLLHLAQDLVFAALRDEFVVHLASSMTTRSRIW